MIEIILRKDMETYESRPIFGRSRREVVTYLALGVACGGIGYVMLGLLALPFEAAIPPLLAVGGGIGYLGFGRPHGLTVERYMSIRKANTLHPPTMRFSGVEVVMGDRTAREADTRSRKEIRADRKAARRDLDELKRLPDELFGLA